MNLAVRALLPLLLALGAAAVEVPQVHQLQLRDIWWQGTLQGRVVYAESVTGDPSQHPNVLGHLEHDSIAWRGKIYPISGYTASADGESFKLTFDLGTLEMTHGKGRCWAGVWTDKAGDIVHFRTFGPMWPDANTHSGHTDKNP